MLRRSAPHDDSGYRVEPARAFWGVVRAVMRAQEGVISGRRLGDRLLEQ